MSLIELNIEVSSKAFVSSLIPLCKHMFEVNTFGTKITKIIFKWNIIIFLFRVYLFLVHNLFFQIISNSKNENLFCSSCLIIHLIPNEYLKICFQRI